ncbi:MAG TPA: hypothetical protein VEL03_15795 [Streptosporangiaceae bacterium]|nr:hypothetical protein [Streptosporangiaceae bacterium]
MTRWKAALGGLWRSEPAVPLVLYFLLAVATAGYISLAGGHLPSGLDLPVGTLPVAAFFTWRMWLGGGYSWTLSVVWRLLSVVVSADACFRAPGLYVFGLLALTLASLLPLFAAAVLDRVTDRSYKFAPLAAIRSAFLAAYQGPARRSGPQPTGGRGGQAA